MNDDVDIAETLVEEADAIGEDLVFDADGNLVSGGTPPVEPNDTE